MYAETGLIIHSSANGHLGCTHLLAIVNNTIMNVDMQVSFQDLPSILLDTYTEVKLLHHTFKLLRVHYTAFHNSYILHSHHQCTNLPISLDPRRS